MMKKKRFQKCVSTTLCRYPEKGQGLVEYILVLTLFSLVVLVGLHAMGVSLGEAFNQIVNALGLSGAPEDGLPPEVDTSLQVRVVNPANEGVPGVQVFVYQDGRTYNDLSGITDSNGETTFELEAGVYSFMAFYQLEFFTSGNYTVPGDTLAVIQVAPKDFPVRVTAADGSGIPNVAVLAFREDGIYTGNSVVTNALGVADFSMFEGNFKFRASYQGAYYWSAVYILPGVTEGEIQTQRQAFPVRVQDLGGSPMEAVQVSAYREDDTFSGVSGKTGSDGIVRLELAEGQFKFRAPYMDEVYWSEVVNVHAIGGATLTIPQTSFRVRVVDSKGKGISDVGVYGYREDGTTYVDRYDRTDRDGYVTFTLIQGRFKFRASYQDNDHWSGVVNVPADGEAVIQTGEDDFTVYVVDEDGAGIANITVLAYNPSGKYLGIAGTTDSQGKATLPVSNGTYVFKAVVKGVEYWSDKVNTSQQKSATIVVTTPADSQAYTIRLTKQNNKALEGADVYVRYANDDYTGISATTDSEGQITVKLQPGSYKFRVDYQQKSWVSAAYGFPESDPLTIKVPVK